MDVLIILAIENEGKYVGRTLRKLFEASHESEEQGVSTEVIVADNSTDDTFLGATKYVKIDRQGHVPIFPRWITRKNCPGVDSMLSIIMPVLNEERYIGRCLDVLSLSSKYFDEVLIVDGGSTDKTLKIAENYPKVKCSTYTIGREYGARNYGASVAKGEYLLFLDADTLVYPEMFRRIYKSIRDRIDCLASTDTTISENLLLKIQSYGYNLVRILLAKLRLRFFTTGNFILIRRDVFSSLGGFEEDINGDGRLGNKVIVNKFCYALLNCYRYVYVSGRRAKNGVLAANKHYFYAIENYLPSLNRFELFRKKRDLFNLLWKNRMLG